MIVRAYKVRFVPEGDYSHRSKQPHYSTTASARAINVR
jgi:hypothetical protein